MGKGTLFRRFGDRAGLAQALLHEHTSKLQDACHVAATVYFVLTRPKETVIPEIMVLPMTETSWP